MSPEEFRNATIMAVASFLFGAAGRIAIALHAGVRRWLPLLIEAFLGGVLGVIAAGAAVWYDPALRDVGWPLLIVSSAAGCAGAIGTRILDLLILFIEKRTDR